MSGGSICGCGCGGPSAGPGEQRRPDAPYNPPGRTALENRVGTYGSFLAAMLDRLASPAYPALRGLSVRTPDDPAIGLLDASAVLGDLLTFHAERIADEGYLRTAHDPRSLALLGQLVGHRPRPGVSADTLLAYTLDRDPRAAAGTPVLIPRGARSHSVPAASGQDAQTFETSEDLTARWEWNELAVRRRRPALLTADDLRERPELYVEGVDTSLAAGDRLLFVFGAGTSADAAGRVLLPVARVRVDREQGITAIGLPQSVPPTLGELREELRRWITEPAGDPDDAGEQPPTPGTPGPRPVSRLFDDFDDQVLAPLRADLDALATPAAFQARLTGPHERLAEAQALALGYEEVAAWFERLEAVVGELCRRAAELEPAQPAPPAEARTPRTPPESGGAAAMRALGAVLPALRTAPSRTPSRTRVPGRLFAPGSDLAAQVLTTLDHRLSGGLYPAWRQAVTAPTAAADPQLLRQILALRTTAAPFGSTAPLKPVQDERGRVIRQSDWPLTGAALTTVRIVYDTAGKTPQRAEFQHTEAGVSAQRSENLPAEAVFPLGPGRIALSTRTGPDNNLGWLVRRPVDSQEAGATVRMMPGLPDRTVFVSWPGEDGRSHVVVQNGTSQPLDWTLAPGEARQATHGTYEVTVRCAGGGEPPSVEIGIATVPSAPDRLVLPLDTVDDGIAVGSWVAVERPRKGAEGADGIPGDKRLALVTTRVTAVRTVVHANYGMTGRGSELTLADPWLDEHDVLLSHIRDAVVHARGEELRPADEPLGEDVHGNELELAELYDGLTPGRLLLVSGVRSDPPGTAGLTATEPAVIAAVEQSIDPALPGDHVHTRLTLTADLSHRYLRESVRVLGNVVPATHGESREEPIGSGDADATHQTCALWQSPLTWLPADEPLGAVPTLEVRVDGLLWHRVDSLAGHGPGDRVYVLGAASDGRTTVAFGDGVHGARLPTGHENVRARYRFGTGSAGNVAAGRITQAVTRPLGVTAVTNPLPATGGADPDGPGMTRRTVPLAVSALDRLVSVADYADFARSRAGIGRAAARRLFDGRRQLLHVTVAGVDDVPVEDDADVMDALRASLATYGDPRLPVQVAARELVLLVLVAGVKVAPDHSWEQVEPRVRQALLERLGYAGRELGQAARLSEVLAVAQSVPGVDYVDVDAFTGVPASVTADELTRLSGTLFEPADVVPARQATYDEQFHRVEGEGGNGNRNGETLTAVAARYGIALERLLRLNPDITDTRPLAPGQTVCVFRGIRPAQLALFSPLHADTLILTEVHQ